MYAKDDIIANRYKLLFPLGQGSYAEVWAALDINTKREVAIKICKSSPMTKDEEEQEKTIQRFCDEIKLMVHVRSKYVVDILDYGKEKEKFPPYNWFYYIIMEKMKQTIAKTLEEKRSHNQGGFNQNQFLKYAIQLLAGLVNLHTQNIIHRDIKPSNLFFDQEDVAKIGDLGIAKLSREENLTHSIFGTIGYAAPELLEQTRSFSIQSDIYSMGISFYEMLALQHPCSDKENFYLSKENIQRIVEGDYTPLTLLRSDIPDNIIRLIYQMIHPDPQERPQSTEELLEKFQDIRFSFVKQYIIQGMDFQNKNNPKQAKLCYLEAMQLYPEYATTYNKLGQLYYEYKKYKRSITYFQQSITFKKNKYTYNNLGLCYYHLRKYNEAIYNFSKAIKLDQKFFQAYNNRGVSYYKKKEYNRAIQNFNKVLILTGKDYNAYFNRGLVYIEKNEYQKAIYDFTKATLIDPNSHEAYYNRAIAYKKNNQLKQARADFAKALTLSNHE